MHNLSNKPQAKIIFKILKQQSIGEKFSLHASSLSMWPLIDIGDKLECVRLSIGQIRLNQLAVFYSENDQKIFVHRVIKKTKTNRTKLVTRGDTNDLDDPVLIDANHFLGKVTIIDKKVGQIFVGNSQTFSILKKRKGVSGQIILKFFLYCFHKPQFYRLLQKFI